MRSVSLLLSLIAVTIVVATSSGFCEENSTLSIADLQAFTDASRQLREEGRLEPFSLEEEYPKEHPLTLGEWTITVHRLGGSRAFVIVGLTNSKRSDSYGDVFADAATLQVCAKEGSRCTAFICPVQDS